MPHQSDVAFMSFFMPVLNPASVGEYLAFGEYGYALSRFSGMWSGSRRSRRPSNRALDRVARRPPFHAPDFAPPPGGLHLSLARPAGPQIEERMEAKKRAVLAFAEANPIDRRIYDLPEARFGFITTGKAIST